MLNHPAHQIGRLAGEVRELGLMQSEAHPLDPDNGSLRRSTFVGEPLPARAESAERSRKSVK